MTSVTVQLTPEAEEKLRCQADQRGQTLQAYLQELVEHEAKDAAGADILVQESAWLTQRSEEEVLATRQQVFSQSPPPRELPPGKTILDMVVGKWPGTESDAEIWEALDRLS